MAYAAIASGVVAIGGAVFGSLSARKREKKAQRKAKKLKAEIRHLENTRQEVINPYENVSDLSSMIQDVSGMASNPTLNLSVATQAAEMQAEEADIALANTLDTLAATGASAGGATALAQAALKSKQGISASIEQQESRNQELSEKARVQGEQRLQDIGMAESRRVQGAKMGEAQRLQDAEIRGSAYEWEATERREMQKLNRRSAELTQQQAAASQASSDKTAAIMGGVSAVGNIAGSALSA